MLAHALLDAAESLGARRQSVQAAAGVSLDEQGRMDGWLGLAQFARLIEAAVEQSGDPAFGLHWGERSPLSNFGIVGSVALWSPSPRTAIAALLRFQGLLFQGGALGDLRVVGRNASLAVHLDWLPHSGARRAYSEFSVVGTRMLLQSLCGRSRTTLRATFAHAAPPYVEEYHRILGRDLTFDCEEVRIDLDVAQLDVALPQFNPRLNEAVLFEASCALDRLGSGQRCSARVREQLASAWLSVPTMEDVARKLGMSSRTLRRHLEQEGTSYPGLLADALRSRALRLLGDPHISIKEVAFALGFATPSAFHRAFKRWTGYSPSDVRAGRASVDDSQRSYTSL